MPMYSASPARDPLFRGREPHERYPGQDHCYGTDPTPNQPSYQPPRLPIGTSNGNIDANSNENANPPPNPLLWDDDAFIKAAESLLLKRKLAALSATKYIYSKMDPLERSQFAAAYSRRYQRMPMFPASDETVLQRWMRHIEDDFGDAFLQVVVVDSVSPPPPQIPVVDPRHMARQEPNHSLLQSIPVVGPQSNPNEQREWSTNNSQTNQHQHRQPPSPMQQERPVYYNDSTSAQLPRRKYRGTKSPIRRDKLEPMQQHQKQQRIAPTNVAFVEAYTPTSILRKSRLGVDSVAQIMEVLPPANPSISEIAPSTQRPGTSSVMKLQSTTRQSLMQEIAYVHRLLTTMTNTDGRCSHTNNNDRDLAYYTEHLFILKEQLRRLSEDEGIKYDGSEANLFMRAVQNLNADESVVEMDQIVGPAPIVSIRNIERDSDRRDDRLRSNSPRLLLMPHRLSERNVPSPANPKRDEVQTHSKTEQKWSRRDDEAAHASIPKVVSFERSPTCSYAEQWNDDGMSNSIVDRATSDLIGLTTAIIKNDAPPVQMVAPANLPGGYQIDAQLNDESFRVTVPEGGVSIGQTFAAKRVDGTTTARYDGDKKWKAGLFDCLAHGIAHPIFCNSFFCPQIALSQILTRMHTSQHEQVRMTFISQPHKRLRIKTVLFLSAGLFLLDLLLVCTIMAPANVAAKIFSAILLCSCNMPVAFSFCHWVFQTKTLVRTAYDIPVVGKHFPWEEDVVTSACCMPCSVAQMMQQTADYDTYRAIWCSESGLPNGAGAAENDYG